MTRVKICGVKRVEDALVAAEAGADFLGLMFFKGSKRAIDADTAGEISAAVRGRMRIVGVFVHADPIEMNLLARECGLDYVQLSGNEPDDTIERLDVPAIRVVHAHPDTPREELAEKIERSPAELVLVDAAAKGMYGGTGQTFDWSLLPALTRPVLLAGGLDRDNVAAAVERVRPWGVDVSSGVETNGQKDPQRIRAFIERAKTWA
jgi:phosphoribosylanthranilate isomerase